MLRKHKLKRQEYVKRRDAEIHAKMQREAEEAAARAAETPPDPAAGWSLEDDLGRLVVIGGKRPQFVGRRGRVVALELSGPHPIADVDVIDEGGTVLGQDVFYLHELEKIETAAA